MITPPKDIKAKRDERVLQIVWRDDRTDRFPFKFLRTRCGCAVCVDEFTGRRLLDPVRIPEDITIRDMSLVGNYAAKILWSDGHDTGIYTWDNLRKLAAEMSAAPSPGT